MIDVETKGEKGGSRGNLSCDGLCEVVAVIRLGVSGG